MLNLDEVKATLAAYAAIEPRLSALAKYHYNTVGVKDYASYGFKGFEPDGSGGVTLFLEDDEDYHYSNSYELTIEELLALEPAYDAAIVEAERRRQVYEAQRKVELANAAIEKAASQARWKSEQAAGQEATERKVLAQHKAKYEGK